MFRRGRSVSKRDGEGGGEALGQTGRRGLCGPCLRDGGFEVEAERTRGRLKKLNGDACLGRGLFGSGGGQGWGM